MRLCAREAEERLLLQPCSWASLQPAASSMGVRMDTPAKLILLLINPSTTELSVWGKAGKGLLSLRHSLTREHQLYCYKLLPHFSCLK